jgi:competence protein CoiA
MKFAVVDGERREAQPGLAGKCPVYGHAMIAKCGEHRVHHWAHRGTRTCDPWWEPETKWHRDWKNQFPEDWQEKPHQSDDGEKHIADVKTDFGVVLEFQHSFLRRAEREAREKFYQKMVWVVDGLTRVRDKKRFFASLTRDHSIVNEKPLTYSVRPNEGALLRDWGDSRKPVFFDFGDNNVFDLLRFGMPLLWRLHPHSPDGKALLSPVTKTSFRDRCLKRSPLKGIDYSSEVRPRSLGLIDLEDAWLRRASVTLRLV